MNRLMIRAIRAQLEPLSKGQITDGNEAIKTIAQALLALTAAAHEDALDGMSEADFRKRVDEIRAGAEARDREVERQKGGPDPSKALEGDQPETAAHVPMAHGTQGEEVRRQMLDARAHAGDGEEAAREAGAGRSGE